MSSPPRDIPTSDLDDVEMDQDPSQPAVPLFLEGTPSVAGTPQRGSVARRALGMSTPRRNTPLFAGTSSPLAIPSSTPSKPRTPARVQRALDFNVPGSMDSEPLAFPSTPTVVTPKNRRGDIRSSFRMTPSSATRRARPNTGFANDDLRSDGTHIDMPPSSAPDLSARAEPSEDEPDEIRAIWGTNVNIGDTMKTFKEFLRGFKVKYRIAYDRERGERTRVLSSPEEGEMLLYEAYLRRMRQTGETGLNLDMNNLAAYPPSKKLYTQLAKYPEDVVPSMDQTLKDVMLELAEEDQLAGMDGMRDEEGEVEISDIMQKVYQIRPFGIPSVNMRELNPSDTDKLVCIKGLVIRATPVIPNMQVAFFRCLTCNHTVQVEIDRGKIDEPARCPRDVCGSIGTMTLVHNRSVFADRQVIRLQETPDAVPDGQTPHTVSLSVYDDLVDVSKPGDRLVVTGIFRSVPVRINPRQRALKSLFKTFLDVVHIRIGSAERLGNDRSTRSAGVDRIPGVGGVGGGIDVDDDEESGEDRQRRTTKREEMEAKIRALSERPDVYELLASSLAPSVYAMDDVKKGILLQLFGGTNKSIARGGGGGGPRYRGDINVLLVGDPGMSKSQILMYVHKIAPRGVYTSGKGSSAVGLTAYVTRDPDTKQLVLESGALVLSDGGICCIDEFDKMSDATRSVLHEVMEQQTVSIAKAGIITTLNARTSILAAANPIGSKYNANETVTRNIDLPPTLISRFDLLYLIIDHVDEALDRKLAQHMVGLYLEDAPQTAGRTETLPLEELSAYITYARTRVHPTITEEAGDELVRAYVALRSAGADPRASERRVTATTRQLESMVRLAEAHARMRLSPFVELQDAREAHRLMRDAIRAGARDPVTGEIDMGVLDTGVGRQQRRAREDMRKALLGLLDGPRGVRWADALARLEAQSSVRVSAPEFGEVVRALEQEGVVRVVGERERRVIRRVEGS